MSLINNRTYKTIKFNHRVTFLGRNGTMKSIGVEVMNSPDLDGLVYLTPITSKNTPGRCEIQIPKENLPELIEALQSCL